jgi:hypothetical protein
LSGVLDLVILDMIILIIEVISIIIIINYIRVQRDVLKMIKTIILLDFICWTIVE